MEKWVEFVRLVIGRKMGKTSNGRGLSEKWVKTRKGRGLPEKWQKNGKN